MCELLPYPAWLAGKSGRPSVYCTRDVADPLTQRPGVEGAAADFPLAWTVYYGAAKWQFDGSTRTMHNQSCPLPG